MSDADDSSGAPGIPAWQRDQKQTDVEPQPQPEQPSQDAKNELPSEDSLETARRFLQDEDIKDAPREAKEEFLKTKGLSAQEIDKLLDASSAPEPEHDTTPAAQTSTPEPKQAPTTITQPPPPPPPTDEPLHSRQTDNPPVITYPEFLTKPTRPPPLITVNGIFNTLYAFAGLSTFLYGTSKYVVAPMVETLTEARHDLHDTTARNLSKIVSKLETTVSEIPTTKSLSADAHKDDASTDSADDPTELFHRDIGTQTSIPSTPKFGSASGAADSNMSASEKQAERLVNFRASAKWLNDSIIADAEDAADLKAKMDVLRDDLVQLAYPGPQDYVGSYSLYGGQRKNEPEDEIKKARDNIRRIKGVLLSTRNFPTTARAS
ncbi:Peroxisomal membrane protein PEX14 [Colletotrichum chlorophyti]|uniref:Peroxisomal membrane protein PEX14 n=1 Tax=Colletotrichum chlorophyti TaxID=708187 RepID=A0A1Q8S1W2_9PEZI|nr:Peroxisomal membrane protein PEX14 [Colletotrichum chlorophyti]